MCHSFKPLEAESVEGWKCVRLIDGVLYSPMAGTPLVEGPVPKVGKVECAYVPDHYGLVCMCKREKTARRYCVLPTEGDNWQEGIARVRLSGQLFTCLTDDKPCYAGSVVDSIGPVELIRTAEEREV